MFVTKSMKFSEVISVYDTFVFPQWNNIFNSMKTFVWMITESIKFSDMEWIKHLFKPTKRPSLGKRLNNTSQNNTMT